MNLVYLNFRFNSISQVPQDLIFDLKNKIYNNPKSRICMFFEGNNLTYDKIKEVVPYSYFPNVNENILNCTPYSRYDIAIAELRKAFFQSEYTRYLTSHFSTFNSFVRKALSTNYYAFCETHKISSGKIKRSLQEIDDYALKSYNQRHTSKDAFYCIPFVTDLNPFQFDQNFKTVEKEIHDFFRRFREKP